MARIGVGTEIEVVEGVFAGKIGYVRYISAKGSHTDGHATVHLCTMRQLLVRRHRMEYQGWQKFAPMSGDDVLLELSCLKRLTVAAAKVKAV